MDTRTYRINGITQQGYKRTAIEGRFCLLMCFRRFVLGYVLNYLHCINDSKQWVELTRGERESRGTDAGAVD